MAVGRGSDVAQILGHGHGGMFCTKTYTVALSYKLATRVELHNKHFSWETSLVAKTIFDFACSYTAVSVKLH